jgi:hypothetical protein
MKTGSKKTLSFRNTDKQKAAINQAAFFIDS